MEEIAGTSIDTLNGNISKKHKCEICEKVLTSKKTLQNHFTGVHNKIEKKLLICNICTKYFQAHYLKKHIHAVHEGHKDYKCESCGK